MKKIFILAFTVLAFSCKGKSEESFEKEEKTVEAKSVELTPVEIGKTIFEGKGACASCHKMEEKLVGPSMLEIAKKYKEENASIVSFLKEEHEAIVDPSQYEVMKPNLILTKTFSDKELQGLEAYIYTTLN